MCTVGFKAMAATAAVKVSIAKSDLVLGIDIDIPLLWWLSTSIITYPRRFCNRVDNLCPLEIIIKNVLGHNTTESHDRDKQKS